MLKHFVVDKTRHEKVVDVEFYQMSLIKAVEAARKEDPELFVEDGIYLPCWSKFAKNPLKAKGFFARMIEAIFLGEGNADDMNADYQFNAVPKQRVAMMFMSIDNAQLETVVALAKGLLKGYHVVGIGGVFDVKNVNAEVITKNAIQIAKDNGESVLIISGGMAQRSYSVPEITELYLAYDNGEAGATIQKMSRALTPGDAGKIGRIVSLSFDPNRDDKFDQMLVTTAKNYQQTHGLPSLKEALKKVIATVDIFRCTDDGRDRFEFDTYLAQLLQNNSLTRICGKTADIGAIDQETLRALASGNAEYFRNKQAERAQKGKANAPADPKPRPARDDDMDEKEFNAMMKKARDVIVTIVEHIDILVYGVGMESIDDTLNAIDADEEMQKVVAQKFGVDYSVIRFLFDQQIINRDLVELYWSAL